MTMKSKAPPVDLIFKAFSDPTRLRILRMLQEGELCVCDLVSVLGVPQPKVSRHLSYLRKSGLVRVRKEGLWCHYELAPAKNAFHGKILECLSCCFSDVPEMRRDAKCLTEKRQRSCCG
jgi:ArsR family transcriptional regulator, arsenate/arsenite/antimonite-responsive transcriptional repressor